MFTLTLVTPEKKLVAGQEVDEVFVPGFRGELDILPGHAPLLTTLGIGALKYRLKGDPKLYYVAVADGYCQVNPTGVNVLAETAERPDEIDVERADRAAVEAEKVVNSANVDAADVEKMQQKILRARARREVASQNGAKA
jgi:F-type H+-transporting ATPase subunit epsilon